MKQAYGTDNRKEEERNERNDPALYIPWWQKAKTDEETES